MKKPEWMEENPLVFVIMVVLILLLLFLVVKMNLGETNAIKSMFSRIK